jgi:hypothetical protein
LSLAIRTIPSPKGRIANHEQKKAKKNPRVFGVGEEKKDAFTNREIGRKYIPRMV